MKRTVYTPEQLQAKIKELGPWFHNIDLGGVLTAPDHFLGDYPRVKWRRFADAIPSDLRGKSVLDIGCNAGFYSVEMKRRGADRVVAIDTNEAYLAQAQFVAEYHEVDIEFRKLSVYELPQLQSRFDLVLFMGVFYHLRYPLLALDLIHDHVADDILVFQSMLRGSRKTCEPAEDYPFAEEEVFRRGTFPRLYFVEKRFANDPTNWWIPNRSCAEALLRVAGFRIAGHPETEVFVCRRTERETSVPDFLRFLRGRS